MGSAEPTVLLFPRVAYLKGFVVRLLIMVYGGLVTLSTRLRGLSFAAGLEGCYT